LPPPSDSAGAGQSFQLSFWAGRSSLFELSLQPVSTVDSTAAESASAAARGGDGFGMLPILRSCGAGRSGHGPCG
jgi:hypothetical protein